MKRNQNKQNYKHVCVACEESFQYNSQLKYHIRKCHFNLTGHAPYCDSRTINQVWFEKVANTDTIVEIKKIGNNNLLIKKLNKNTPIKPTEMEREVIDLRFKYPTCPIKKRVLQCRVCSEMYNRKQLNKHFAESHKNLFKMSCDECKTQFTRLVNCVTHICPVSSLK